MGQESSSLLPENSQILTPSVAIAKSIKLLIRGSGASGKSSLFARISGKNLPYNGQHIRSPEIQTTTVLWRSAAQKERIKLQLWDVIDEAYIDNDIEEPINDKTLETTLLQKIREASIPSLESSSSSTGNYLLGPLDSIMMNVYQTTNDDDLLVIFVIDPFSEYSLEYVKKNYKDVPKNAAILLMLNKKDLTIDENNDDDDDDDDDDNDNDNEIIWTIDDVEKLVNQINDKNENTNCSVIEASMVDCYGLKALNNWIEFNFLKQRKINLQEQLDNVIKSLEDIKPVLSYDEYIKTLNIKKKVKNKNQKHDIKDIKNESQSELDKAKLNEIIKGKSSTVKMDEFIPTRDVSQNLEDFFNEEESDDDERKNISSRFYQVDSII